MVKKSSNSDKNTQQIMHRVAEINNSDNLNSFSYGDLADTMQMFVDGAIAETSEGRAAVAKLQSAINQRLTRVVEGQEPLSVDDLSALNQLKGYITNDSMKSKVEATINQIIDEYEEVNGLNLDEEVLRKNDASLDQHLSNTDLYRDGEISPAFYDIRGIIDRVQVVSSDQQGAALSEADKAKNLEVLFEAAKLDAYRQNVGSIKYLMSTQAEQRQMLSETVQEIFMAKLGQVAFASEITRPTAEELQDDAKFQAYVERTNKESIEKLNNLVVSNEKIVATTDTIVAACAESDVKASFFKQQLEDRLGEGKSKFGARLAKFKEKASALWGKKYEITRAIANNMKDGRYRLIADTLATVGVGAVVATSAPLAVAAFASYGAYTAIGAYWHPFLTEANKIQRIAKENGQKIKFGQAWKIAIAKLKGTPEHKKAARWGVVSGILGAGLGIGALGVGLGTAAARVGSTLGRMAGSTSSQFHGWMQAKKAYEQNKTAENEARLETARTGLGLGLVIAAATSYISLDNVGPEALQGLSKFADNIGDKLSTPGAVADTLILPDGSKFGTPLIIPNPQTADSLIVETASVDTTETIPYSPVAITTEVDVPQIGDILSQKDHGNGIVETITLGKNGINYQDVTGLSGGMETSAEVQAFYERRIANMNQFNYLINMVESPEGAFMDANQAVECMKKQIELGFVELPEGVTPEHAIHTAFMHGHYTGNMSAINALSCPNGEDTVEMFSQLSSQYSTDPGFIGRPIDPEIKLPMRAGTIDVKTPCGPVEYAPVQETEVNIVPDLPPAPQPIVINEVSVNYAVEPQATVEYPSAYAGNNSYPTNNDAGFHLFMEDRKGDGLTAKEVYAPNDREGYKLTGDNRITLGVETSDKDVTAYQTQRQFNIRDGYVTASEGFVSNLAEGMGGKVGEAFAYEVDGKEFIKYISQEGTIVTFDPENSYQATIENVIEGQGVPKDIQEATLQQAIASVNEQANGDVALNGYTKPETASELTKIKTSKGNVYARISVISGRNSR